MLSDFDKYMEMIQAHPNNYILTGAHCSSVASPAGAPPPKGSITYEWISHGRVQHLQYSMSEAVVRPTVV